MSEKVVPMQDCSHSSKYFQAHYTDVRHYEAVVCPLQEYAIICLTLKKSAASWCFLGRKVQRCSAVRLLWGKGTRSSHCKLIHLSSKSMQIDANRRNERCASICIASRAFDRSCSGESIRARSSLLSILGEENQTPRLVKLNCEVQTLRRYHTMACFHL